MDLFVFQPTPNSPPPSTHGTKLSPLSLLTHRTRSLSRKTREYGRISYPLPRRLPLLTNQEQLPQPHIRTIQHPAIRSLDMLTLYHLVRLRELSQASLLDSLPSVLASLLCLGSGVDGGAQLEG